VSGEIETFLDTNLDGTSCVITLKKGTQKIKELQCRATKPDNFETPCAKAYVMTTIDPTHMRHGANESQRTELQSCALRYQLHEICPFLAIIFAVSLEAPDIRFRRAERWRPRRSAQEFLSLETHSNAILVIPGFNALD
jgi:hypothetical protein